MKKESIFKPDFFIVGAPKCGTTSLYFYLQQHQNIFLAPKELYYFGNDFTYLHSNASLSHYQSFFKDANVDQLIGEASVWYLYSKAAATEIKAYNPNAKIIIMLRQPADMIYSLHQHQLFNGNENITDFKMALEAQPTRALGNKIPSQLGCPIEGLQYQQVGKYYEQVKRYFDVFGKKNIHIVWYDDFKYDSASEYKKVCSFLSILPLKNINLSVQNKSQRARSIKFTQLLKNRSVFAIKLAKLLLPSRKLRYKLLNNLWKMNSVSAEKKPLSEDLTRHLDQFFLKDIEHLEKLTTKNLNHWKIRAKNQRNKNLV